MGSGQTVSERERAVGGSEYVRGEVFLVGERENVGVTPEKFSVIVKGKNLKLPIYHILLSQLSLLINLRRFVLLLIA